MSDCGIHCESVSTDKVIELSSRSWRNYFDGLLPRLKSL